MTCLDPDRLVLVVVGAHLRAELGDRPLAYRLADRLSNALAEHNGQAAPPDPGDDSDADESPAGLIALPCTDIWYLNNEPLQRRPAVSIGGPGVNALSAYLYERLPTALSIDDELVIQLDPAFDQTRAALWGIDSERTSAAVARFEERYLEDFVAAVVDAD